LFTRHSLLPFNISQVYLGYDDGDGIVSAAAAVSPQQEYFVHFPQALTLTVGGGVFVK
jgi:hypothetical protein